MKRSRQEFALLSCRDVSEMTTDYLDGALPWGQRLALRFHLSICSFCRRHLLQLRETIGLLHRMPVQPPPQTVEDQVVARLATDPDMEPSPSG